MSIFNNDRYEKYYTTLIGKQLAEQYVDAFQNAEKSYRAVYSNAFVENDDYWIINITKLFMKKPRYDNHERIAGSLAYTLYMHKHKDLVILKAPNICSVYSNSSMPYDNNIRRYYSYKLNKLGYTKYEFLRDKKLLEAFTDMYTYMNSTVKILIPKDKTDDDLVELFTFIDKFNDFVLMNPLNVWDDLKDIKKRVNL